MQQRSDGRSATVLRRSFSLANLQKIQIALRNHGYYPGAVDGFSVNIRRSEYRGSRHAQLLGTGMKILKLFRVTLGLIVIGLTPSVGLCQSEATGGNSGPLTAFRVNAFLGWAIELRNDSDATYTAIYAINEWAGLRVVPPHSTVRAGYVLGREIPVFQFAPKVGRSRGFSAATPAD